MENELKNRAPSNSPITIHEMSKTSYSKFQDEVSYKYGFVGLKLDKLSLTADVTEDFYTSILMVSLFYMIILELLNQI